jgi:hypothetical protein
MYAANGNPAIDRATPLAVAGMGARTAGICALIL